MDSVFYCGKFSPQEALFRLGSLVKESAATFAAGSKKILGDVSAMKKTAQLALKIVEAIELCTGKNLQDHKFCLGMQKGTEACVFYDTYQDVAYWIKASKAPTSLVPSIYTACFTLADCGSCLLYLKKWNWIAPLLNRQLKGMTQKSLSSLDCLVAALTDRTMQKQVVTIGLFFVLVEASNKNTQARHHYLQAKETQEKELTYRKWRSSLLKTMAAGTNLFLMIAPQFLPSSPSFPTRLLLVSLTIFAKSVSVASILERA